MYNVEKKLVKLIKFYSDGTYEEVIPEQVDQEYTQELQDIFDNPVASRRIKFNVATYVVAKRIGINDAFQVLAENQQVTRQTVVDKTYRQLDLSAEKYKKLLQSAIDSESGLESLKIYLMKYIGTRTENSDMELIEKYLVY